MRVAWVEAERGYGKTRLLAEIAHRASMRGGLILYAAIEPHVDGLQLIADLSRDLMTVSERTVPQDLRTVLDVTSNIAPHASPELRLLRMRTALHDLLTDAAVGRAVLILIDDAHSLDLEGADTLTQLVDRSPSDIRFVVTATPTRHVARIRGELLRRGSAITTLHAFGEDEVSELVAAHGQTSILPPDCAWCRK